MYLDRRNAAVCLVWTLAFAYSFAPFDVVFDRWRTANLDLGVPEDLAQLVALGLHLLAFAALGATDRITSPKSHAGPSLVRLGLTKGLLFCLAIELGQIFVASRHAELSDLAVNGSGLAIGHLLGDGAYRLRPRALSRLLTSQPPFVPVTLQIVWAVFWSLLLLLPSRFVGLDGWDRGYPLVIGHERQQQRPWTGEIRYLAIYDRRLWAADVRSTRDHPPGVASSTPSRLSMGLLVAYDFTEVGRFELEPQGRIEDSSLWIRLPSSAQWNISNAAALALGEGTRVASRASASALSTLIASSGSLSVEIWCHMANLSKGGVAPLIGISDTVWRRNFAVSQNGHDLYFSVRNALNGPNGARFELHVPNAVTTDRVQIVATYDGGVSSMFVNGRPLRTTVDLREPSVLLGLGTGPAGHFVTAMLCALSLIMLKSWLSKRRITALDLIRLLLVGYACLLLPFLAGSLLSFRPAVSLHLWFAPAFMLSSVLVVRPRAR